jgi:hypothetical protein
MNRLNIYFLIYIFVLSAGLCAQSTLMEVKVNGKAGYIDTSGKMIIQPQFRYGLSFNLNGNAFVRLENGYAVIDTTGKILDGKVFEDYVGTYNWEGITRIVVKNNGKYGLLNDDFSEVQPYIFDEIKQFQSGIAIAVYQGKKGCINMKGAFTALGQFEKTDNMGMGFIGVKKKDHPDEMWIYNVITHKELGPYNAVNWGGSFHFGKHTIYAYNQGGYEVVMDTLGNVLIWPKQNLSITDPYFTDSIYSVTVFESLGGETPQRGIMDNKGNFILKPTREYYDIGLFTSYKTGVFAEYQLKSKEGIRTYGIMDAQGKIIIEASYQNLSIYDEGKIRVKINGKWGLMDWHENIILPAIYDEIVFFNDDIAEVRVGRDYDEKKGYLNLKTGKLIWPLTHTHEQY